MSINRAITGLVGYAVATRLIEEGDRAYATGRIMKLLALDDYAPEKYDVARTLAEMLDEILDYAVKKGLIENDSVVYRDLFDTELMGVFVDRPSAVTAKFERLYASSPEA